MKLYNLERSNLIQKDLQEFYIERLKKVYPEYEIFQPISEPDFIIFRKKIGETNFGKLTVGLYRDIRIHYTQLVNLS